MRTCLFSLLAFTLALGAAAQAQSYTQSTLHTFTSAYNFCPGPTGICPNGAEPSGQIVESGGLLYGTGQYGGGSSGNGQGVVYQLDPATSAETVIYYFPSSARPKA